jgi:hypothetical protein
MHGENHLTYLNNGPMVKDFFLSMEVKEGEKFKPSHLHSKLIG